MRLGGYIEIIGEETIAQIHAAAQLLNERSVVIFQFLWVWNDLLVSLMYLGGTPNVAPVTLKVANLVGSRGQDWELLTAAAFISMALPLVVFFSLQRYFVRGILAGSVKG
jgi:alpha-glucoside transport system permease protein